MCVEVHADAVGEKLYRLSTGVKGFAVPWLGVQSCKEKLIMDIDTANKPLAASKMGSTFPSVVLLRYPTTCNNFFVKEKGDFCVVFRFT
ncbi:hypothetical protein TNCV_2260921 [Trichonephila clavipes]|nr:hypothetical protein TNCV_2260921 [Trichonephila clavipes]